MVIQFCNRKEELKTLANQLNKIGFGLIIIYGRRRIGKTSLILEATKNKKRLYYMAVEKGNLEGFYKKCVELFPEASKLRKDWEVLFEYIKNEVEVVIIDEFQNSIKEDKSIISLFQRIVDTTLLNSNLKLVLLGSTVSVITSKVLSYKSPLYGRKTFSMKLKPVKFSALKDFFPEKSVEELVEIYGFADGIPYYLTKIGRKEGFWEWLQKELAEKTFLTDEIDFLMRYEFEEVGTYKAILYAIAYGKTKINEIKDFTGLSRTDISPYLKNLIETDLIVKKIPILEKQQTRKGRYYLKDNFLAFWFRYIFPNLSSIEEGIFDIKAIKQDYNSYLGVVFEKICKEALVELIKQKKLPSFTKIGKQWGSYTAKNEETGRIEKKNYEIDLVTLNEKTKEILFAECKWREKINAEKIIKDLIKKSRLVNWHKNKRKEYFVVFAKSFGKRIDSFEGKKVYCFDLKDLEKLFSAF